MMKLFYLVLTTSFMLSISSCTMKEMNIDAHLKENSLRFDIKVDQKQADNPLSFGHFSAYDKEVGLAWMEHLGISSYFNESARYTFSCDNNDNYTYDIVASPIDIPEKVLEYAQKVKIPLDQVDPFEKAYVAYLYAPHDEYSMIFIQYGANNHKGYLTNGFEQYEIVPVLESSDGKEKSGGKLLGYQTILNEEYVGSLQMEPNKVFRMTTEYCDATEMVLASIASTLIKFEQI